MRGLFSAPPISHFFAQISHNKPTGYHPYFSAGGVVGTQSAPAPLFFSHKLNNRHFDLNDRHFDRSNSRSLRVAEWRNLLLYLDRWSATTPLPLPCNCSSKKAHGCAACERLIKEHEFTRCNDLSFRQKHFFNHQATFGRRPQINDFIAAQLRPSTPSLNRAR